VIIAANFKANKTRSETTDYLKEIEACIADNAISDEVLVFPPATALQEHSGRIVVGAQNVHPVSNGAFTGEIGLDQIDEFGIKMVLIGHSERRHIFGESQEIVAEKFDFFKNLGFTIVYCIGEPIEIREEGNEALMAYLDDQLEGIDIHYEKLIIAYEPVWAIGTGLTPDESDIELIHSALRQKIDKPLLYGGSVKVANAKEILAIDNVDGALIGSGALKAEDFCQIIMYAKELEN